MALQEEFKTQGDFLFRNRSLLPLLFLGVGMAVLIHTEYNAIKSPETSFYYLYEYGCLAVALLGLWIRIKTVGHSAKNTSGRNTKKGQIADELNTTGIYSWVRHPLYVGNFLMWLGVAMLTENTWFIIAFIFFYVIYYERIMYAEESFLRQKFGSLYLDWAKVVPAFIPNFKHYKQAQCPFNIKKVLKKEKNGLCAVFLIFWLFDLITESIKKGSFTIALNFWFYAAVISTLIYIVLKIMKKRKMLED